MTQSHAVLGGKTLTKPVHQYLWFATLALLGTLVLTLSAKITVPMWPIQTSLQTLAVFLIAAMFGFRLGMATILLYLAEGLAGFPVFQGTPEKGIGLAYMAGPTAGYLIGFVGATAIIGKAADLGWAKNLFKIGGAMLLGEIAILVLGASWLAVLFGPEKAITFGIGPFIITDLIKLAIAACLATALVALPGRLKRT